MGNIEIDSEILFFAVRIPNPGPSPLILVSILVFSFLFVFFSSFFFLLCSSQPPPFRGSSLPLILLILLQSLPQITHLPQTHPSNASEVVVIVSRWLKQGLQISSTEAHASGLRRCAPHRRGGASAMGRLHLRNGEACASGPSGHLGRFLRLGSLVLVRWAMFLGSSSMGLNRNLWQIELICHFLSSDFSWQTD